MSRRRTGNIAQLPRAIRDHVNRMLDDGCRFKAIIAWLDQNGHPGITGKQLTRWRAGGFQDYLDLNQELARQEKVREMSYEIATANEGCKTQEAALRIAANFLFQIFLKFDPAKLAKQLDMKPQQITTVLNAFTRLSRRSDELDMIKEYKQEQASRHQVAADVAMIAQVPPGLSDEGESQIERDYNLC